ncbi:MAG: hypothetical protein E7626_01640 [Ruminococcaceae bacterium]|nr:hypothetical protein [Oscillospiraceae bacterium]
MRKINKFLYFCLLNCIFALLTGVAIYVLLRENTYINKLINFQKIGVSSAFADFLRFYFVDALWSYALTFALSIFISEIMAGVISTVFATSWELLQLCGFVAGTFDIIDLIMYLSAIVVAVLIIYLYKRRFSQ